MIARTLALSLVLAWVSTAVAGPPCLKMPQHATAFQKHCGGVSTTITPPTTTTTTTDRPPALDIGAVCGAPLGAPPALDPFVTLAAGDPVRCLVSARNAGGGILDVTALELAIHHLSGDVVDRIAGTPLLGSQTQTFTLDSVVAPDDATARCNVSLGACASASECPGELCIGFCDGQQDACFPENPVTCPCEGVLPATAAVEVGTARSTFGMGVAVALP